MTISRILSALPPTVRQKIVKVSEEKNVTIQQAVKILLKG